MYKLPVQRLLIKTLWLFLLLIIADQAIGFLFRRAYFSQRSGDYFRTTYVMDSLQAPFLVLGGSRAAHHYIPSILDSALGLKVYNTGRDDNEIFYSLSVFRAVTERYRPSFLILELAPKEMYFARKSYYKLASLLPYYRYHPEIRDIIRLRSKVEHIKLLSAIYPFNSKFFLIAIGQWNLNNDPGISTSGYLAFQSVMKAGLPDNQQPEPAGGLDSNKVNAIEEIISGCQKKHIGLLMVCSPVYSNQLCPQADAVLHRLSKCYKVPYWIFRRIRPLTIIQGCSGTTAI